MSDQGRAEGVAVRRRSIALLACPLCAEMMHARGLGCLVCGATDEDIDRMEPGPWDDWR